MAQNEKASVFGLVRDSLDQLIDGVTVSVIGETTVGLTNEKGYFKILVNANKPLQIRLNYFGSKGQNFDIPALKPKEKYELNVSLNVGLVLGPVEIKDDRYRQQISSFTIDPKPLAALPNISGSVEQILKTLPGVSSNNELSAQYNVRGGNFDENLVYVNDIEIYRPFLPRSGQQEGLSFIHSELVKNIKFSAGGFEAKYGDKMSSVLDIKYKDPKKAASSVNIGLLGVQAATEGASKNLRFTYLIGARYWSNKYVVSTLDTKGDYQPSFTDVQALLTYHFRSDLSLSILSSYAQNRYFLVPTDRQTTFGTVKQALQLNVYFDGADLMEYRTTTTAASLVYNPTRKLQLKLISSMFYSNENELFTIEGAYRLSELETDQGSANFGRAKSLRGVGYFINNARNGVEATVVNVGHRGSYNKGKNNIQWGTFVQTENIYDKLKEWNYRDSAGFAQPTLDSNGNLTLLDYLRTSLSLNTFRLNGYIQNTRVLNSNNNMVLTYGIRSNWWSYTNENVISPRFQFSFEPNKKHNKKIFETNKTDSNWSKKMRKNWIVKASYGWYYQTPFYRELRYSFDSLAGKLNPNIKSQKSIHYVLGAEMNFKAWNRPFKFTAEAYYKDLTNLIPYEIDNVRIRYFAQNISQGYATGIDFRVNGEFVRGTESWASLSLMNTEEIISNQFTKDKVLERERYIPRLTNQAFQFAILFQDYFPSNPSYKVNLMLVYGSGFPFGIPDHNRYNDINTMPSYRRVDIGFTKDLIAEKLKPKQRNSFLKKNIKHANIAVEVFNLLGVDNTISYTWLQDATAQTWAVPNYLTSRRLNVR
ncbi:MAG: TonB-dependent receptor plug domain-containing protein, partial [Bacteroidia bacterium]